MLMKKTKRTILTSILVAILCFAYALTIDAKGNEHLKTKDIYFNEQAVTFTVLDQNGYQLVPASLFRQVGATVEWNNETKTLDVSKENNKVRLPIGENNAYYMLPDSNEWRSDENLLTETTLVDGKSYIPLAYTANKLGIEVEYDTELRAARLLIEQLAIDPINITVTESISPSLSDEDIYWLYRLTEAEAGGESYDGKLAVAATVLNRVEHDDWPDKVVDIIFQVVYVNGKAYYQFEPVFNKYIYSVTPSEETMKAVQAAINGDDPTNGAVVFYNPQKTTNKWVLSRTITVAIGDHVFAQ